MILAHDWQLPLTLALVILVAARCQAATFVEEDGLIVLNESNFHDAVRQFPEMLLYFYSPNCGFCSQMTPIYIEAAKMTKQAGLSVRLAKMDVTKNKEFFKSTNRSGVPTLLLYLSGSGHDEPTEYLGERQANAIIRWLKKKTISVADSVLTTDELWNLLRDNELVAVGFFQNRNSAAAKAFVEVADEIDQYAFALAVGDQIYKEFGISTDTVVVLKQFDEGRVYSAESITQSYLKSFLREHCEPLVVPLDEQFGTRKYRYFISEIQRFLLIFVNKTSDDFQTTINGIFPVAHAFRGQVVVNYVDISSERLTNQMEQYGISVSECPTILYIDHMKRKFKLTGDRFLWNNVEQFIHDADDGKVAVYYKSGQLPADWNSQSVKVLVQKNFNEVAHDVTKNVFVKFYASWCGHCQKLAPVWEQLADHFSHRSDLVIAKIDAVANEIEGITIEGLPTLIFFPRGGGEAVFYEGEKTFEKLVEFVNGGGKVAEQSAKTEL